MKKRKHPFYLNTEASINLVDDDQLMHQMVKAGFEAVFIGIESPNDESLLNVINLRTANRDLISSVKKIQQQDWKYREDLLSALIMIRL
jgi:radical SAM superfamily enzyme YgiQ (UPF0313 family)